MISLPLWLHLCYYMIYSNSFVSSLEKAQISNDQSQLMSLNTKFDGDINGSNINEINTPEHSHSSEETKDATDPVSNQTSDDSKPVDSSVVTEAPITQASSEQEHSHTSKETRDSADRDSNQSFKASRPKSDMLIDLDITKTKSTREFNYSKEGNVVTYTAKEGYGFYVVKEGKSCCNCCGSDIVIWQSRFRSQYLNKVVIETGPNEEKTLTIYSVDGTTAVAKKVKDGNFVVQNDDSSDDSKPVESSSVTEAPTAEPTSEEEPTETPEDTKDSPDPVSQESDKPKPVDSSPVTETPTAEPTCEQEPSETPEETTDSADHVYRASENLELDATAPTEAPTDEPTSEQEPTETPTDEPSSEQEDSETPAETRDSTDPVSNQKSETPSPEVKLIDLDLKKTNSTTEFDYSKNGNVVTYTPKQGYGFGTVKIKKGSCSCWGSDKVVWEAENKSNHSNKVVVESGSDKQKTLTIHCVDGTTKVYKKVKDADFVLQNDDSSKGSNPVDSSSVSEAPTAELKLVDLDITNSESTAEFDYSSEGKVSTYTAKEGYGFGTVKKGKSGWNCTGSDEIIREAKDKTQASNKVTVSKVSDGTTTLLYSIEIYLLDGSKLIYCNSNSKDSQFYNKWVQKSEDVPKDLHPAEIKIYTKDETKDEPVENDTSKYKVNIFNEGQSSKYFYYIKDNVKCTKVKYNNDEVWNDTESYKNFDRLTYNTGDKSIVLEYKSTAFKKYKISDEPKQK